MMGNIFTHYNYTTTDIRQTTNGNFLSVASQKSGFSVSIDIDARDVLLPSTSPFADWKEARRFAGPLPFTFTYRPETKTVLIIEGVRENWVPAPVKVIDFRFAFIDSLGLKDVQLANAFIIRNIPYHWKKGKTERWKE